MDIYRNPFIVAIWAPVYQLVATIAITNDFLMMAIFIMFTLGGFVLFLASPLGLLATPQTFRVMSYNVENFWDSEA